jgi:hypothetical protein
VIGHTLIRLVAASLNAGVWLFAVWDSWHTRHPGDPWATDE